MKSSQKSTVVVGAGADTFTSACSKQQTTVVNERIAAGEEEVVKNEWTVGPERVQTRRRAPGHHKIAAEGQEGTTPLSGR